MPNLSNALRLIQQSAIRVDALSADGSWLDKSLPELGEAELVLLGEATHGTHDFYRMRAEITKRLIAERGFSAVAIEGDWPDAYRVNRYVRGLGSDSDGEVALSEFKRFPSWMWRNADVLDFVGWLRSYNDSLGATEPKAGFYGLDLYSLYGSMEAVLEYLRRRDPEAAQRARLRYACFDLFEGNTQAYGYLAGSGLSKTCEDEAVAQLQELHMHRLDYLSTNGMTAEEELFFAQQNARVVKNAEAYYRTMLKGRILSWNLRDQHMAETLNLLREHLQHLGIAPKIIVWAHNSHVGDARATEMGHRGEWNVGEIVRRQYREEAFLLGFTTYQGTVTAASDWDAPGGRKDIVPALPNSFEALFHEVGHPRFLLDLRGNVFLRHVLQEPRLERAIGVLYRPETERMSHYFMARLPEQFDAVFHIDQTRAVEPLEKTPEWETGEAPETYPSAL